MSNFERNNVAKISLVAVEGCMVSVEAHYNPAEIQIEQATTWNAEPTGTMKTPARSQGRALSMELLFDVAEMARPRGAQRAIDGMHLTGTIEKLSMLGRPKAEEGKDEERRPPMLRLANGPIPDMMCVMESVSIKITRFDELYRPVRATVSVKLRELTDTQKKASLSDGFTPGIFGRWVAAAFETPDERAERMQRISSFDKDRK